MTRRNRSRPKITLKLATSLDGKIATRTGASKWITGEEARAGVHEMRASHDCVLTGIGTVLADDPEMTARTVPSQSSQPLRAVLDTNIRTPADARLLKTANLGPIVLFHGMGYVKNAPSDREGNIYRCYVNRLKQDGGGLDLMYCLKLLHANFGVEKLMVEAGGRLATAFLRAGLVDELVWFRAPILIGQDGLSSIGELNVDSLKDAIRLEVKFVGKMGKDLMEIYQVSAK